MQLWNWHPIMPSSRANLAAWPISWRQSPATLAIILIIAWAVCSSGVLWMVFLPRRRRCMQFFTIDVLGSQGLLPPKTWASDSARLSVEQGDPSFHGCLRFWHDPHPIYLQAQFFSSKVSQQQKRVSTKTRSISPSPNSSPPARVLSCCLRWLVVAVGTLDCRFLGHCANPRSLNCTRRIWQRVDSIN